MHELFNKPLAELSREDIDALVQRGDSEDQYMEFKEKPPGKADMWQKAAPDLASEVVAFANADGGVLVLGIKDEDNRATGVVPIPEAAKAADSLSRSFTSTIDPYPVGLEVAAVPYDETGGVVVARVPASPEAPHGVKDKQRFRVTVRRGEQAKPLDMRDIQLHTLETRRRADDAEQRLEARRAAFKRINFMEAGSPLSGGYRITVTPARAIYRVSALGDHADARRGLLRWEVTNERDATHNVTSCLPFAFARQGWRPCLRGLTAQCNTPEHGLVTFAAFEDGTADLSVLPPWGGPPLEGWQVLGDVLALVDAAADMRAAAGAGRAELMVDVEFAHIGPDPRETDPEAAGMTVEVGMGNDSRDGGRDAVRTPLRFPRYTLVEREDLSRVAAEFWRDLCDVAGVTGMPAITAVERPGR